MRPVNCQHCETAHDCTRVCRCMVRQSWPPASWLHRQEGSTVAVFVILLMLAWLDPSTWGKSTASCTGIQTYETAGTGICEKYETAGAVNPFNPFNAFHLCIYHQYLGTGICEKYQQSGPEQNHLVQGTRAVNSILQ